MSGQGEPATPEAPRSHGDSGEASGGVDQRIIRYMACHPVLLIDHVRTLLEVPRSTASERLNVLTAAGLITHGPRLRHQEAGYRVTAWGLREIGSELPVPRVDLRRYWQDIGAAWMWIIARRGGFGNIERVFSRHEMRAADHKAAAVRGTVDPAWSPAVRAKAADSFFGMRLVSDAPGSQAGLHYPDLMLVVPQGRVAIELQITTPGRRQLETTLSAYALRSSIAAVLYLPPDGVIGNAVQVATARLGLTGLIHLQNAHFDLAAR